MRCFYTVALCISYGFLPKVSVVVDNHLSRSPQPSHSWPCIDRPVFAHELFLILKNLIL